MSYHIIYACRMCGRALETRFGPCLTNNWHTCDSCYDRKEGKWQELREMSYDAQKEAIKKARLGFHGHIINAWLELYHPLRPEIEKYYTCDWCETKMDKPASSYRAFVIFNSANSGETTHHRCTRCQRKFESMQEESERNKKDELRRNGF